ncbi:MAG: phosphoserine phosphatase, partial [Eubacterium sp.]|nr:phosphoserine phosphatase [Eubacterium sp.]
SIDKDTGKFTRLCFLENKVKIFNELYPNCHIENFYTDSMNDKAMMDIADHVYLVKKNKITKIK